MKVSVVLPTFNEEEGIVSVVADVLATGRSAGLDLEVVVVDDHSPDGTATKVGSAFAGEPAVRLVVREGVRGLATALRRGIELSGGEVVVLMNSDGNQPPGRIPLMARLAGEFDLVVGSRFVAGGGMTASRLYVWGAWAFNLLARAALGLRVRDTTQCYLAFRKTLLMDCPLDRVFYGFGDCALRLIFWAERTGRSIIEVPVMNEARRGGAPKTRLPLRFIQYLASVVRLRMRGLSEPP